jgi:hypothetical protein
MKWLLGVGIGAVVGYLWHRATGSSCSAEACPITSNPWISTLYGALMGAALTFK